MHTDTHSHDTYPLSPSHSHTHTHSDEFSFPSKPHPESPSSGEKIYTVVVLQVHHKSSALKPLAFTNPWFLTWFAAKWMQWKERKSGGSMKLYQELHRNFRRGSAVQWLIGFKHNRHTVINTWEKESSGNYIRRLAYIVFLRAVYSFGGAPPGSYVEVSWGAWRGQPRPGHWGEAVEWAVQSLHMIQVNCTLLASVIVAWDICVSKIYEVKNDGTLPWWYQWISGNVNSFLTVPPTSPPLYSIWFLMYHFDHLNVWQNCKGKHLTPISETMSSSFHMLSINQHEFQTGVCLYMQEPRSVCRWCRSFQLTSVESL